MLKALVCFSYFMHHYLKSFRILLYNLMDKEVCKVGLICECSHQIIALDRAPKISSLLPNWYLYPDSTFIGPVVSEAKVVVSVSLSGEGSCKGHAINIHSKNSIETLLELKLNGSFRFQIDFYKSMFCCMIVKVRISSLRQNYICGWIDLYMKIALT